MFQKATANVRVSYEYAGVCFVNILFHNYQLEHFLIIYIVYYGI